MILRKKEYIVPLNFQEEFGEKLKEAMEKCDGTLYTIESPDKKKKVSFSCYNKQVVSVTFNFDFIKRFNLFKLWKKHQ